MLKIAELIKLIVIELLTAFNSTNFKIRKIAEEIFLSIAELMRHFNALA
jgi:hypothetical protein